MAENRQVQRRRLVVRASPRPSACAGAPIERGVGWLAPLRRNVQAAISKQSILGLLVQRVFIGRLGSRNSPTAQPYAGVKPGSIRCALGKRASKRRIALVMVVRQRMFPMQRCGPHRRIVSALACDECGSASGQKTVGIVLRGEGDGRTTIPLRMCVPPPRCRAWHARESEIAIARR